VVYNDRSSPTSPLNQTGGNMSESENEKKENVKSLALVEVSSNGTLVARNMHGLWQVANAFVKSKLLPRAFDTPEKAFVGLQFCGELGIKPLAGLKNICVINGTPALFGSLPLALVRQSGNLKHFREWIEDEKGNEICPENKNLSAKPFAAICEIQRNGDEKAQKYFFTTKDAESAQLYKNAVWKMYERDMLKFKARSRALNEKFADIFFGMTIAEDRFDRLPEKEDMNTINAEYDRINENVNLTDTFIKKDEEPDEVQQPILEPAPETKEPEPDNAEFEAIKSLIGNANNALLEDLTKRIYSGMFTENQRLELIDFVDIRTEEIRSVGPKTGSKRLPF